MPEFFRPEFHKARPETYRHFCACTRNQHNRMSKTGILGRHWGHFAEFQIGFAPSRTLLIHTREWRPWNTTEFGDLESKRTNKKDSPSQKIST